METVEGELRSFGHVLDTKLRQVRVVIISDLHFGNPLFSEKHFDRTLKFVLDNQDVFVILNGDLCESSLKSSKGDIYKQVGSPQDQRDWVIERLLPIQNRILGVTTGNHENRIYNDCGIDISKDIASTLAVPYRAEGMLLKIMFGKGNSYHEEKPYVYWCYATHGYGGARTKGGKSVKVERLATWIHADIYIMSHDHVVNVSPDVYLVPDNRQLVDKQSGFLTGKVTAHRKMLIKSNAYIKHGGYAELGGFPPVDLETPIIILHGEGNKRVQVLV